VRTLHALSLFLCLGEEVAIHVIIDFRFLILLLLNGFAVTAMLLLLGLQSSENQFRDSAEADRKGTRDANEETGLIINGRSATTEGRKNRRRSVAIIGANYRGTLNDDVTRFIHRPRENRVGDFYIPRRVKLHANHYVKRSTIPFVTFFIAGRINVFQSPLFLSLSLSLSR